MKKITIHHVTRIEVTPRSRSASTTKGQVAGTQFHVTRSGLREVHGGAPVLRDAGDHRADLRICR